MDISFDILSSDISAECSMDDAECKSPPRRYILDWLSTTCSPAKDKAIAYKRSYKEALGKLITSSPPPKMSRLSIMECGVNGIKPVNVRFGSLLISLIIC